MADTFKFTLYEFFGYFVPGAVAFAATAFIDLIAFHHQVKPELDWTLSKPGIALGIGLSYLLGHAVQILANAILPQSNTSVLKAKRFKTTAVLLADVKSKWPKQKATDDEVIRTCEHEVIVSGPTSEREIYVYREGFYRGMAVSLTAMCFGCVLAISVPTYRSYVFQFGTSLSELGALALLSASLAVGMYVRAIRFANYRISLTLCYYLLPDSKKGKRNKSGSSDKAESSTDASEDDPNEEDNA